MLKSVALHRITDRTSVQLGPEEGLGRVWLVGRAMKFRISLLAVACSALSHFLLLARPQQKRTASHPITNMEPEEEPNKEDSSLNKTLFQVPGSFCRV